MRFLKRVQYNSVVNAFDVFTEVEAKEIIALKSKGQKMDGEYLTNQISALRLCNMTLLKHDDPDATWIYQRVSELALMVNNKYFYMDLTYFEPLQLTEYNASDNGHFGQHIDVEYGVDVGDVRKLSITIQLSNPEDYEGGELKMFPATFTGPLIAIKKLGSSVLFRSHIIHEVEPVTKGTRYSLVAWAHGPLPK